MHRMHSFTKSWGKHLLISETTRTFGSPSLQGLGIRLFLPVPILRNSVPVLPARKQADYHESGLSRSGSHSLLLYMATVWVVDCSWLWSVI